MDSRFAWWIMGAFSALLPGLLARAQCYSATALVTNPPAFVQSIDQNAFVFDATRNQAIGWAGDRLAVLSNATWTGVQLGTQPPSRGSACMAYDDDRGVAWLFGGLTQVGPNFVRFDDLWMWNGAGWTQVPRAGAWPAPRYGASMVYDSARGVLVLHGGNVAFSQALLDTWEFNPSTGLWTLAAATGPGLCTCVDNDWSQMFYDSWRGEVVLVVPNTPVTTWVWQGGAWVLRASGGVTPTIGFGLTYDSNRHLGVLIGGEIVPPGGGATQVLAWNGASWSPLFVGGIDVRGQALAYDPFRRSVLIPYLAPVAGAQTVKLWDGLPGFLVQPQGGPHCAGENVVLGVSVASDTPVMYQWRKDGQPIGGATSSVLAISSVSPAGAGMYDCVVTNSCGSVTSGAAEITVITPPSITIQPIADPEACPGSSVAIVGPGVAGTAPLTIQLQKQCGEFWCDVPGQVNAIGNVFVLQNVSNTDTGAYRFAVSNTCGTAITGSFHIQVGVTFDSLYQDVSVTPCETAVFTLSASGVGALSYQWYHGTTALADDGRITGSRTPTLTIAGVRYEDEGQYQCAVSDLCQTLSPGVKTLSIPGSPAWVLRTSSGPTRRLAYTTDMAYDESRGVCVLYGGFGGPMSTYLGDTWEWSGLEWVQKFPAHSPGPRSEAELVYDASRGVVLLFGGYSPGVGFNADVWAYDGNDWTLLTTSPGGPPVEYFKQGDAAFDRARAKLVVLSEYQPATQPNSTTWEMDSATLQWQQTFQGPAPYFRDGPLAYDVSRSSLYGQSDNLTGNWRTTWRYSSGAWSAISNALTPARYWPVLAYDATRRRVTMFGCCRDIGSPSVYRTDTYAFDGSIWTGVLPDIHTNQFDALVPAAMVYDTRRRAMVVVGNTYNNNVGSNPVDTWEYRYFDRPSFDRQPQDQDLVVGQTAQFSVIALGRGLLNYQWQKDSVPLSNGATPHGSAIAGATTATLTISNAQPQDRGVYDVVVTNACGSQTSTGARLGGPCRPDLTTTAIPGQAGYGVPNGVLNNDDFFYYLIEFSAGNVAVADLTTTAIAGSPGYGVPNGIINNDDFFYYLTIFTAGC